jgi:hypothetical protein
MHPRTEGESTGTDYRPTRAIMPGRNREARLVRHAVEDRDVPQDSKIGLQGGRVEASNREMGVMRICSGRSRHLSPPGAVTLKRRRKMLTSQEPMKMRPMGALVLPCRQADLP